MRSLVLGYRDDHGQADVRGPGRDGLQRKMLAGLEAQRRQLAVDACPFDRVPPREPDRVMHWVRPELVALVRFTGWTADGVLRHPSFGGLVEGDPQPAKLR